MRCATLPPSICLLLKGKEKFLATLHRHMEIHGTVYYETQRPPEVPAFVKNHGLLPQPELQQLLRKAKVGQHQESSSEPLSCFVALFFSLKHLSPLAALHWVWLPLRRPRPSGGHSQWLHILAAQIRSPSQLPQPRVLQREAHL